MLSIQEDMKGPFIDRSQAHRNAFALSEKGKKASVHFTGWMNGGGWGKEINLKSL